MPPPLGGRPATGVAVVRVWDFEGLHRVLESDPALAAPFFRALAETSVERLRSLATSASLGGLGPAKAPAGLGGAEGDQARAIASRVQGLWLEADVRLRRDAMDAEAEGEVRAGFALLLQEATAWLRSFSVAEAAAEAGASLSRELRPYLARSELAQLCLDPPAGRSGHPRQLAHVLLADATGDDALGRTLDACILALPTCAALRARASIARTVVEEALPEGRPPRILLVNATRAPGVADRPVGAGGAVIHAMDGSREALAFLDAGIPARPASVELKLLQQDLGALVLGCAPLSDSVHDVIVLDFVDYLPDRLVASLLSWASGSLAPGGAVVITARAVAGRGALRPCPAVADCSSLRSAAVRAGRGGGLRRGRHPRAVHIPRARRGGGRPAQGPLTPFRKPFVSGACPCGRTCVAFPTSAIGRTR